MQQLSTAVAKLDPAARESVKIIKYFDALLSEQVGVDGLLRAASILTGCAIGVKAASGKLIRRVDTDGSAQPHPGFLEPGWMIAPIGNQAHVWIERREGINANDPMVIERLSLVMEVALERRTHRGHQPLVEVLLDPAATMSGKNAAVVNFGLDPHDEVRAVATPAVVRQESPIYEAVYPTDAGLLRASILHDSPRKGPAGLGFPVPIVDFQRSWHAAVSALKLSTPENPIVDAFDLGVLLQFDRFDPDDPDLATLLKTNKAFPWAIPTLTAIVANYSIRAAASQLNLHHSTVQTRVSMLTELLGFNPQAPLGRMRSTALLAVWKLQTTHF